MLESQGKYNCNWNKLLEHFPMENVAEHKTFKLKVKVW